MRTAIFQFYIGNFSKAQEVSIRSVQNYCTKYNIDYIYSNQIRIHGPHLMFEKLQILEILQNDTFDRILYLDTDIIITPKARNIFSIYNSPDYFYAFDENMNKSGMDRENEIHEHLINMYWPKNKYNKKQYFNAGVMLFSKKSVKNILNISDLLKDIPNWPNIYSMGDQTSINYWIVKNNVPFHTLEYSFNRMDLGGCPDPQEERFDADFIHYAGAGYGDKHNNMIRDWNKLYGDLL
jgi:lipopolysaccharide biosynthesis glycosyltransferase